MTVARCLRCLKDFENDCVGSCLEFSTPVFLFLRWLAFGVAAGCLLLSKLWKSYRKVSQSNTKNAAHWHRTAAILYDILKKKEGGCFRESARELTSNGYARGCALQD